MNKLPPSLKVAFHLLPPSPEPTRSYATETPCTETLPTHTPYPPPSAQRYLNDTTRTLHCTSTQERDHVSGAANVLERPPMVICEDRHLLLEQPAHAHLQSAAFSCLRARATQRVRQGFMARAKQRHSAQLQARSRRTPIAHACRRRTCTCSGRSKGLTRRQKGLHFSLSLGEAVKGMLGIP